MANAQTAATASVPCHALPSCTKASPKNDPDAAAQHTTTPPSKLPRVNALGTHFHVFISQI